MNTNMRIYNDNIIDRRQWPIMNPFDPGPGTPCLEFDLIQACDCWTLASVSGSSSNTEHEYTHRWIEHDIYCCWRSDRYSCSCGGWDIHLSHHSCRGDGDDRLGVTKQEGTSGQSGRGRRKDHSVNARRSGGNGVRSSRTNRESDHCWSV